MITDITLYQRGFGGANNIAFERYLKDKSNVIRFKTLPYRYRNYLFHPSSIFSKIHFLTHDAPLDHYASRIARLALNTKVIQSWHGFPLKALGKNIKFKETDFKKKHGTTFFLSYGDLYTEVFSESYNLKNIHNFISTGMPRNDLLYQGCSKNRLYDLFDTNNDAKRVIYCPTFRDQSSHYYKFEEVVEYFSKTLEKLLTEANLEIYLKPHVRDLKLIKGLIPRSKRIKLITDELLSVTYTDLYEILNAFDLLITDYSSIYIDWLLTGKPVMFFVPDLKEYEEIRGFTLNPFNKWTPGPKSFNFNSLTKNIKDWLSGTDNYSEERERLTDIIHQHQDGLSSDRVFNQIISPIIYST
ncbi:MAG: CDP-glycerol glycerophosphotransferase family protein [Balneolaceae bacterium]|nr:CDP-glycerol glycerophosphotransferase family protein [Balneolaceae bacterium]